MVRGDTNGYCDEDGCAADIFVRDRLRGVTTRANVSSGGAQSKKGSYSFYPAISGTDGRFVAFQSDAANLVPGDTNGVPDIFVRTRCTCLTAIAHPATASSPSARAS